MLANARDFIQRRIFHGRGSAGALRTFLPVSTAAFASALTSVKKGRSQTSLRAALAANEHLARAVRAAPRLNQHHRESGSGGHGGRGPAQGLVCIANNHGISIDTEMALIQLQLGDFRT